MASSFQSGTVDTIPEPSGTDSRDGAIGGIKLSTTLAKLTDAVLAIQQVLLGEASVDGGITLVPSATGPALLVQFGPGSGAGGISVKDHLGNFIEGVGSTGGEKVTGDRIQASLDTVHWIALDGTTTPPCLLMPSATYGAGNHMWFPSTNMATDWVSGTTKVNDIAFCQASAQWMICITSGAGTAAGTWVNFGWTWGTDGFGNNQAILNTDGHILTWSLAGLYPASPIEFGTPTQPWASGNVRVPVNAQTANYVPVVGDFAHLVEMNSASATTVTLNTGIHAAGNWFDVRRYGAGTVTFVAGSGFTIRTPNTLAITAQYGKAKVEYRSGTEAVLSGLI